MAQHTLTPGDLRELRVEPVKSKVATEDYSILMNVSWVLRADGKFTSIKVSPDVPNNAEMCRLCRLWDPLIPLQPNRVYAPKATY